jgi:hypothetical protein
MFYRNEFDIGHVLSSWPEITGGPQRRLQSPTAQARQDAVLEYRYPGTADI